MIGDQLTPDGPGAEPSGRRRLPGYIRGAAVTQVIKSTGRKASANADPDRAGRNTNTDPNPTVVVRNRNSDPDPTVIVGEWADETVVVSDVFDLESGPTVSLGEVADAGDVGDMADVADSTVVVSGTSVVISGADDDLDLDLDATSIVRSPAPIRAVRKDPIRAARQDPIRAARQEPVRPARQEPIRAANSEDPIWIGEEDPIQAAWEQPLIAALARRKSIAENGPTNNGPTNNGPTEAIRRQPVINVIWRGSADVLAPGPGSDGVSSWSTWTWTAWTERQKSKRVWWLPILVGVIGLGILFAVAFLLVRALNGNAANW